MGLRLGAYPRALALGGVTGIFAGSGGGPAKIKIYSGAQPTDPDTAASGTLLATFTLSDPAFSGTADGGGGTQVTLNTVAAVTAAATGTAGWFRLFDGNGNGHVDGTVGASGSGANLILSTTSIASGGSVSITSGTITMPLGV